jgi:hypothetical protein
MFQPLDTVLFYTWLGYSPAMPRKLVWIKCQYRLAMPRARPNVIRPGIELGDVLRDHTVATTVVGAGGVAVPE